MNGFFGVRLEVLSKCDNEVIDGSSLWERRVTPHNFEDFFAAHDLVGSRDEKAQKAGLALGYAGGFPLTRSDFIPSKLMQKPCPKV